MTFNVGDAVLVPVSRLKGFESYHKSVYPTKVLSIDKRSIQVDLPGGVISERIGVSVCHKHLLILVIEIGDLSTENTLLDPLNKTLVQFLRLVLPDDMILSLKTRSIDDIRAVMHLHHAELSHIILIGHGSATAIRFGASADIAVDDLAAALHVKGSPQKTIVSLCCDSGQKSFATTMSKIPSCDFYLAPFHSVHGANASQFVQCLLSYHFLQGEGSAVSFKHAQTCEIGPKNFRLWKNGKLLAGPKR